MGVLTAARAAALTTLAAAAIAAPAAAQSLPPLPIPIPVIGGKTGAPVQPYGTNDARGFRNILPAGEAGTDNAADFATFQSIGKRPNHWEDQQPLYDGLIFASPTLTHDQIADFFKDATFGVPEGQTESTIVPRDGVTIVRDSKYGIPHIYGTTRGNVEFGAGYAGAQDRLFLMDILRHTARAQLSSFVGGAASNRTMDRVQWASAPYTEADLQRQIDQAPVLYGAEGQQLIDDARAYVAGINAYIADAKTDPSKMPAEYALFGKPGPDAWQLTDVIAEASLIGGIFGKGGGNELRSALLEQTLEASFGAAAGKRAWADFRSKNDPEAPTTVKGTSFPYETADAFSPAGLAIPDPCTVTFTPVAPPPGGGPGEQAPCAKATTAAVRARRAARAARARRLARAHARRHVAKKRSRRAARARAAGASIGAEMLRALRGHHDMSNWEMVSARYSSNGHPVGVLGPQVGYYDPQILLEEDLHGPGFDARGTSFPGVNLMVQLGHGRDYAWSATTATSDNVDTFAEVLCGGDQHHYLYKGQCLAMDRLDRTNSWTPNITDQTPPGSETLTAWRTVHGIVYAYGKVGDQPVAYALSRTTYMHEADSAIGFFRLNNPDYVHDVDSFRHAVDGINFGFNWGYIDSQHIAYQQSGWYPQRADGTSPDFPVLGTGQYDWKGFDPAAHTSDIVGLDQRPHAVDPPFLVSWNNKQAPGWAAADDKFTYGPVFRSQMIESRIKAAEDKGQVGLEQVVTAMDEPATQDLSAWALIPILKTALGTPSDQASRDALALLSDWAARGAHRRDLDKNGQDEDAKAIALMDAWYPLLTQAEFGGALGDQALAALTKIVRPESVMPAVGDPPSAPDYDDGWFSFVSKDLRDVFTPKAVTGRWSRGYCGGGSPTQCRDDLRASLRTAITKADPTALYGRGECASDATARCFDQNRDVGTSAISMPPFPFQNRPTFQQTVELTLGPRATPASRALPKKKAKAKKKKARVRHRAHPRFTG